MANKLANPAPLGLMGFGMTTVLLNLVNAGIIPESIGMVLPMGLFYGGLAQFLAGMWEMKTGNTFGATAFGSFGSFWMAFALMVYFDGIGFFSHGPTDGIAAFLIIWGIFTALMAVGTLRLNRALQVVFITLALLFFLLALADATGNIIIKTIAGFEGIFCGLSAMYTSIALVLNEVYEKNILPIGPIE